jgi:hypothetical protein
MMGDKFLGIPLFVWAIFCLGVAAVWVAFWPEERAAGAGPLRYFILRWFHALTWLLLAAAAFVAGLNAEANARATRTFAFVSLAVYLIFMATFLMSKR